MFYMYLQILHVILENKLCSKLWEYLLMCCVFFLQPSFPTTVLSPGETYTQTTKYVFTVAQNWRWRPQDFQLFRNFILWESSTFLLFFQTRWVSADSGLDSRAFTANFWFCAACWHFQSVFFTILFSFVFIRHWCSVYMTACIALHTCTIIFIVFHIPYIHCICTCNKK